MTKKETVCITDFDGVLINKDSLLYILIKERLFLVPDIFAKGIIVFLLKALPYRHQLQVRSLFKRALLREIKKISQQEMKNYIKLFRSQINKDILESMRKKYRRVIIVSASEENIIKAVIKDYLKVDKVISNNIEEAGAPFETCWNSNKLKRLTNYLGRIEKYHLELYTDSFEDKPLMDISNKVFIVKSGKVEEYFK